MWGIIGIAARLVCVGMHGGIAPVGKEKENCLGGLVGAQSAHFALLSAHYCVPV